MATKQVDVKDDKFVNKDEKIAKGDTVEWTRSGNNVHTVTSTDAAGIPDKVFDHELKKKGDKYSFVFNSAGTFHYKCRKHNGMNGTVTVT